ncbi:MAG: alpha/beta hydrolase [Cyanomargarita calcarea GSE-NOS-MK-12-04C]|jgi:lysophospholipase L1-like esterase|uniref:Alpha/beta hydrolase n=1 Tax=Cyanomargarita calcarea GSE-NOS-MK-12-04C TaxID=2839659 RepID=A0A951QTP2_9CYAN|nr:alpha/beta hydrolase [Cyanomargarita calcarea GSE-NOS-MK-12-04C]
MINYLFRFLLLLSGCFAFLAVDGFLNGSRSLASEEIVVRYGLFEESLPVADLRKYAETQQASADLRFFLGFLSSEQQQKVKKALQVNMSLDIAALDKLLDTTMGRLILSGLSQANARRDKAGIQALRSAVILGAKSKEGLGIVSFLEAYPSKRLVIDLPKASKLLSLANLSSKSDTPPQDNLSSSPLWQLQVKYQTLATQGKQYSGCLFGDSISAQLGNTLGEGTFNFGLNGLSAISLVEQLQPLVTSKLKCQKTVIAIGGNDAWYGLSDELFVKNLKQAIALVKTMGTKEIFLIPAFYSTVAASLDPTVSAPLAKVEHINALIEQVALTEGVRVEAEGIAPLYDKNVLKDNLTTDGDHLNADGLNIYRQALLKILAK